MAKRRRFIRQRADSPHWWFDFSVQGHRFRGSTETDDPDQAEEIALRERQQAVERIRLGREPRKPEMTLTDAFGRRWIETDQHLSSAPTVAHHARRLIEFLGGDRYLSAITDPDVTDYVARRRATVGNATVNRELAQLAALLRRAREKWHVAVSDVVIRSHFLPERAPRDRYATQDQAARLLAAIIPHARPIVATALLTGLRKGNVLGLRWEHINLQAREITLRVKDRRPGGKAHTLPIVDDLFLELIKLGPKERGPVFVFGVVDCPCISCNDPRRRGQPIKTIRRSFEKAVRAAGIDGFRIHDLRHTAASWLVQAGAPLDVVQDVLGHAHLRTTMRYAHRQTDAKRQAMALALSLDTAQIRHANDGETG